MRHVNAAFLFLLAGPVAGFPSPSSSSSHQTASWRRLSNRILSFFYSPDNTPGVAAAHPDPLGAVGPYRPNPLAARYGQDIVLRFNISTAEEAKAIAEASEDLYLDVWEFNENWVDIRLSKDTVREKLHG
jgi:extracellular matrix protein 14